MVVAALTVTCWPRIARRPISNPLKAPGTRRPGIRPDRRRQTRVPRRRFAITSGRASRSNSARTRLSSAGSTGVRRVRELDQQRVLPCFACVTRIQPVALSELHGPRVRAVRDVFDAGERARARNARIPVQSYGGRYESCRVDVSLLGDRRGAIDRLPAQARRRHPVAAEERVVEPPQAREAAGERDLGHRQRRLRQQLLGQQQPARQQQLDRRHAELLPDDAANLPRAELELVGDGLESRLLVELPLLEALHDQLRNALRVVDRRVPGRQLRAAPQARAEAGLLGLLRRVEEAAIGRLWRLDAGHTGRQ